MTKKNKHINVGLSAAATAQRKGEFVAAYLANGRNAHQAALSAGYSARSACSQGARLLSNANVRAQIDEANTKAAAIAGLSVERTLREIARLAYADPRALFQPDGSLRPVHELDDDTAATVASIEVDEIRQAGSVVGVTRKIKQHSKSQALDMAMKYHQLYSADTPAGTTIINKIYYGKQKS